MTTTSSSKIVECLTYNGYLLRGSDPSHVDLTSWIKPAVTLNGDREQHIPDIIAIGFQELIPLHLALLGLTKSALNLHHEEFRSELRTIFDKSYTILAKKAVGGTALLIFTNDETTTLQVRDVKVATVGCGVANIMGNKGAVGIRVTLDSRGEDVADTTVLTFVSAHLTAHEPNVERRNRDFKNIVSRMVFDQDAESGELSSSLETVEPQGTQIYDDTSFLFFFGDLNYRLSTQQITKFQVQEELGKAYPNLFRLLEHDQLAAQQHLGKTLHHLKEGPITFLPTYKYLIENPEVVETEKEEKSEKPGYTYKRVPSWCDRVLWASWSDESSTKGRRTELLSYRMAPNYYKSDHKPVAALFKLGLPFEQSARLPYSAPYAIDAQWKLKKTIGKAADRLVGLLWYLLIVLGFGQDARIGAGTLLSAIIMGWWYQM